MQGVTLCAVCDIDAQRARQFARRHDIAYHFVDINHMLEDAAPDSVHVLTAPQSHCDIVKKIAGKCTSVLVEKPLANSVDEAHAMVEIANRTQTRLGVCHNYLHLKSVKKAQTMIDSNDLGVINSAELYWRMTSFDGHDRSDAKRWANDLSGGAFHEVAPHPLYILQAFLGELKFLRKDSTSNDYSHGDLSLLFGYGNNKQAMLRISLDSSPIQKYLILRGERKTLFIDIATDMLIVLKPYGSGAIGRACLNLSQASQIVLKTSRNVFRTLKGGIPSSHLAMFREFYSESNGVKANTMLGDKGVAVSEILHEIWSSTC